MLLWIHVSEKKKHNQIKHLKTKNITPPPKKKERKHPKTKTKSTRVKDNLGCFIFTFKGH